MTHLFKPLAAVNGKGYGPVGVHDIYICEIPAVDSQGLSVIFRGVPVALIEGIGLHYSGVFKARLFFHYLFYPGRRCDIGTFGLTGVKLDRYFSGDVLVHLLKHFHDTGC